ncbi:hypothetical protein JAAARDRAFT_323740 [Jaapia argillacea MUCL 33604]|uniref:F-box domain-containing protein n=1 Tax=Jaapia argillacea MUCL 33604 TaxID=933084 RepID=A0A067PLB0_9AGAM|nr:hypothetical protein JAAARDRAFT_323740 [Jaapia argillacea MUCL 33604]
MSAAPRLPVELLRDVFELALPPECITDPCWNVAPASSWSTASRDKQSFVLVCKNWMGVGTEILYEHVAIRRPTQLPLFVCTLESSASDLGCLIKTFTLCCFISHRWKTVFFDNLVTLSSRCLRVKRFILSPHWDPPNPNAVVDSLFSGISLALITHLEINTDMLPYTVENILDHCSRLQSLSLAIPTEAISPKSIRLP